MLWYVCDGIFCIAEANKAWVAKQWQGFYKHGHLSEGKKWVIGGWNNVWTSNLCILRWRHKWSSADVVGMWNTIAFNGKCHIIETKKGIRHYTKCRQCFSFITRAFAHFQFLEWDQNMNQHCYLEILVWLQNVVHLRRTELQPAAYILNHDNLFTHDMLLSGSFWLNIEIEIGPSVILTRFSPVWLLVICKLKTALKGHMFSDTAMWRVTAILNRISEESFQHSFEAWKHCLIECITMQGDGFEGDRSC